MTTPPTTLIWPFADRSCPDAQLGIEVAQIGQTAVAQAGEGTLVAHEGVVADVEAEHLFLEGQPLCLVELEVGDGDSGVGETGAGPIRVGLESGEEGDDPGVVLAAALESSVHDLLEDEAEALTGMARANRRRPP